MTSASESRKSCFPSICLPKDLGSSLDVICEDRAPEVCSYTVPGARLPPHYNIHIKAIEALGLYCACLHIDKSPPATTLTSHRVQFYGTNRSGPQELGPISMFTTESGKTLLYQRKKNLKSAKQKTLVKIASPGQMLSTTALLPLWEIFTHSLLSGLRPQPFLCPAAIITAILHLPPWANYQLKPDDMPSKGNRQALTKFDFYLLDMKITSCTKHRSMSFTDPKQFFKNANVCFVWCRYHTSLQCVSMGVLKWIFRV